MDFFAVISFLFLYYIRPHEWIPVLKAIRPVTLSIILAVVSLFLHRGLKWRDFFQTPHDWFMMAYFVWFYIFSPTMSRTFSMSWQTNPMPVYYCVAIVTLISLGRLQGLLNWWTFFIVALAAIAVASEYGFDPTGSHDLNAGPMKGRLAMSTSVFRNPNALGHSLVVSITMLYFVGIWKRPVFVRIPMIFLMIIPIFAVYLTLSKGAFLTGFATIITALAFRRPKAVQIFIAVVALTAGWSAVQLLPRMQEVESSKTDEAIQGRVMAFRFGLTTMKSKIRGVGYPNFQREFERVYHFQKAPHSSYVRVGAEQGMVGLFLFVGLLYCCVRTLVFAITTSDEEERIRRTLFVMLVGYAVSSWMIGWSDRCTFFLTVAAVGAFHRRLLSHAEPPQEDENSVGVPRVTFATPTQPQLQPVPAGMAPIQMHTAVPTTEIVVEPSTESGETISPRLAALALWNRITWIDLVIVGVLTFFTIGFWEYIMKKM